MNFGSVRSFAHLLRFGAGRPVPSDFAFYNEPYRPYTPTFGVVYRLRRSDFRSLTDDLRLFYIGQRPGTPERSLWTTLNFYENRYSPSSLFFFMNRIDLTPAAADVIDKLRAQNGPLMFHQSGGCCDGSSPMCYAAGDFIIGSSDVWLGRIDGCDFWMSGDQFEYWQHTHLTIDVTPGRGASFSLEIPLGVRFLIRSRLFEPNELANLLPVHVGPLEEV